MTTFSLYATLIPVLKMFEGFVGVPYHDSKGLVTIGYGRCLDRRPFTPDEAAILLRPNIHQTSHVDTYNAVRFSVEGYRDFYTTPLTEAEADALLENDIADFVDKTQLTCKDFWHTIGASRQRALVCMSFQMGIGGLRSFKNMLTALERGDWDRAEQEALDSKWAREDSPNRARLTAQVFRTGNWDHVTFA